MGKKTVLYTRHLEISENLVEFAGYLLPVNYQLGIISEHNIVRNDVGMFDVSHMGEILIKGPQAKEFLEKMMTNNIGKLAPGRVRYTIMCYPNGYCVDDLLVYCLDDDQYLLVVNASNKDKDLNYLKDNCPKDLEITDLSEDYSLLAIQGPNSEKVLSEIMELPNKYFSFIRSGDLIISRTGYTGEDGFEIYGSGEEIVKLWDRLVEKGVKPCGLGCRDTLRFEAGLPLYGHEISDTINPIEGGLSFAVKLEKDFIGKNEILNNTKRKLVGLKLVDRGIAREGNEIYINDERIGVVTTGTKSPTLGYAIANGLIKKEVEEKEVMINVRGKMLKAEIVELPFYKRR